MTQVQVDQILLQKLGGLDESIELCDADGKILGRYLPESAYREILYSSVEIPFSEEELASRRAEAAGCTLDEIWKRLGRT